MIDNAVVLQNITKTFDGLVAVNNVSLKVRRGEILGLLGPNGAGKSTLTNIATGLLTPDSGIVSVMGLDLNSDRDKVKTLQGVVPQEILLYDYLSALENMKFFAVMNGIIGTKAKERIQELIDFVDLDPDALHKEVQYLSGGMKKRVNIACGIMHDPEVIFLDEPTTGLDPTSRISLWQLIRKFNKEGKTIILTTHLLDEAEELCDRIAIMDRGEIVALDTPQALLSKVKTREVIELYTHENPTQYVDQFAQIEEVIQATAEESEDTRQVFLRFLVEHADKALPQLIKKTITVGLHLRQIHVTTPSLADVFMHFTGRQITDDYSDSEKAVAGGVEE